MKISVAFAPSLETPRHIVEAERLGFERAWCYDGPAIWADVWMTLARAADQTREIGLGTAVLVPGYRHVMATAAAVATLAGQAPGRVAIAVGVGHSQHMMGGRATSWTDTEQYITTLRHLLEGEEVVLPSGLATMLHSEGFVARPPVDVPILIGAQGPRGTEVAHRLGQGVVSAVHPVPGFPWSAVLVMGTVLAEGEGLDSERILAAAGPGAAVAYHTAHALTWSKDSRAFAQLPNGEAWAAEISRVPRERRHLASWAKHLVGLTREDQAVLTPELVAQLTFTGTEVELRQRLKSMGEAGATEVIYQPTGPDIPGELARFARMAELAARSTR